MGKLRKAWAASALAFVFTLQGVAPVSTLARDDDKKSGQDNGKGKDQDDGVATASPIKHVIVLIGENRSFDHTFATYVPKHGQTIANLLSKGVILSNGLPGPNFGISKQFKVNTPLPPTYFISVPASSKTAYSPFLPTPELNGAPKAPVSLSQVNSNPTGVQPPFDATVSQATLAANEPSLELSDLNLLRTGATGAGATTGPDLRITNATSLANGSFQITGTLVPYDSYTGDTVHRLFHMWQQSDCSVINATATNPSGCLNDLYPFVATNRDDSGSNSLGFYNMQNGDVPFLKKLADEYTMADNYHQAHMGGTAANHMAMGSADAIFWTTFNGITQPPANIANPNPKSPTSDAFVADNDWTNCSDTTQPGILPIVTYLGTLTPKINPNCDSGHFYEINNMSPGFLPNGQIDTASITAGTKIPPSNLRMIGDALNGKHVSWAYYGGGFDAAVRVANGTPRDAFDELVAKNYCDICNFSSYSNSIMGDPAQRAAHIKDVIDFFEALEDGSLPSVSFVKPDSFLDGHPASSKFDLFEAMTDKILDMLQHNHKLFEETALFIAFDEGGGYWDSGYIQPLDFFGDGPRIPFIVVSPYSRGGKIVHTYYDHVSITKFIERNWGLGPLTSRSRDNFPNPISTAANPYVPTNSPAIGDLFDMFDFDHKDKDKDHDN